MDAGALDANGKGAEDLALDAGHKEIARVIRRWTDRKKVARPSCENCNDGDKIASLTPPAEVSPASAMNDTEYRNDRQSNGSQSSTNGERIKEDAYRLAERQLRGIRTMKQLRTLLRSNRAKISDDSRRTKNDNDVPVHAVTHVLGCPLDEGEEAGEERRAKSLAERHGVVLLRNFVPREVDRLALGVLALRPMEFDLADALDALRAGMKDSDGCFDVLTKIGPSENRMSKSEKKRASGQIEEMKDRLTLPADAAVVPHTNFGPQLQSYSLNNGQEEDDAPKKKRKTTIDSFPLSRLRYINLGGWNYNWGDRRYERAQDATALPDRLVSLARRAHEAAKELTNKGIAAAKLPEFDMAICNLYHLRRPSDRLGGHRDDVESDPTQPLVAVSLGAPGIFLLGGRSREDVPTAVLLRQGDCMIMSRESRGYFHGIPTILLNDDGDGQACAGAASTASTVPVDGVGSIVFPELDERGNLVAINNDVQNKDYVAGDGKANDFIPSLDQMRFVKALLTTIRMNISIRQV